MASADIFSSKDTYHHQPSGHNQSSSLPLAERRVRFAGPLIPVYRYPAEKWGQEETQLDEEEFEDWTEYSEHEHEDSDPEEDRSDDEGRHFQEDLVVALESGDGMGTGSLLRPPASLPLASQASSAHVQPVPIPILSSDSTGGLNWAQQAVGPALAKPFKLSSGKVVDQSKVDLLLDRWDSGEESVGDDSEDDSTGSDNAFGGDSLNHRSVSPSFIHDKQRLKEFYISDDRSLSGLQPIPSPHLSFETSDRDVVPDSPTEHDFFSKKNHDIASISMFKNILQTPHLYRRLLKCTSSEAQGILEHCQILLDSDDLDNDFRRQIVPAMQRLAAKTRKFPSWFFVNGSISLVNEDAVSSGSFGDIYQAKLDGEALCLKVLRANQTILRNLAKSFAKEAILWSQLSHPNVLPFYGLHVFRSQLSFVSPWAENGCIADFVKQERDDVHHILLCLDTALGVDYLHSRGVVHGDIKSANVLVDRSGRAYLADFGLSNIDDPQIVHWTSQSSVASKGGSVRWQAPELHEVEVDESDDREPSLIHNTEMSDIFAWGCLCYEIFTGRLPFYHIRFPYTVLLHILDGHTPLRPKIGDSAWIKNGLTESMWALMEDCWKMDPSKRPNIRTILLRLNLVKPSTDPRQPPQWPAGSAMRFRNSKIGNAKRALEDLGVILSRAAA